MTKTPWAILLTKFSDDNSEPFDIQFCDDLFTSSGSGTNNMVDFYRDVSHGNIDVSGSQVFGWFTLDQKRSDYKGSGANPQGRTDLINWAKAKATANSVSLDSFFGVVVVMNVATDLFGVLGGKAAVCDKASLQPSLLGQEMSHGYGLDHSRADGSTVDYQDPWDVMSTANAYMAPSAKFTNVGPMLNAANMESQGWLDESRVFNAPKSGAVTVQLRPLYRHDLPGNLAARLSEYLIEFRVEASWDAAIPRPAILVHRFEGGHSYIMAGNQGKHDLVAGDFFEVGNPSDPPRGYARVDVQEIDPTALTATIQLSAAEVMAPVPVDRAAPAVASWGKDRLDIFGRGLDETVWHKAWAQAWSPSQEGWEPLGGTFISEPAVASWGQGRLDIFGVGLDKAMYHKAWANEWHPSPAWELLGGGFSSPPVVCSWGPNRLDVFALGLDGSMWHKGWAEAWSPSQEGWEPLGGKFVGKPAVASWGEGRLDIFGVGLDKAMYHKAWANEWHPSPAWELLGGGFSSPPVVCSWGPNRLDIFALGLDGSMWHKAWAEAWFPSQEGWEALGGKFLGVPAVASWGPGRIDIFGIGLDGAMYHRAWDNGWFPWEQLGGIFSSAPTVVSWAPERLDILAVGKDFGVWHKAWAQAWLPSQESWEALSGGFL
jgi:hypothetical protein